MYCVIAGLDDGRCAVMPDTYFGVRYKRELREMAIGERLQVKISLVALG